jgi:DNA-binding response OmpR family regulator
MRYLLLVVEPTRADASRLAAIFDPTRFALVWARDLGAARTALDRFRRVDLVVLETALPDGDGLQLRRALKGTCPGLPVVVLTGEAVARTAADRAGADAFVPKPIEPRAIVETAERLLPPTPRRRRAG